MAARYGAETPCSIGAIGWSVPAAEAGRSIWCLLASADRHREHGGQHPPIVPGMLLISFLRRVTGP
jgi:hypothetical protein